MRAKEEKQTALNLEQALAITSYSERRTQALLLLDKGVELTPLLIENTIATYDEVLIQKTIERAMEIGMKPSSKCFEVTFSGLLKALCREELNNASDDVLANTLVNFYKIKAHTIQLLIKAGTPVTAEIVARFQEDIATADCSSSPNALSLQAATKDVLQAHGLESVPKMLANEFNRIKEIRMASRVLGQAGRDPKRNSFFSTLPQELVAVIAAKRGSLENDVEDHASDIELAVNNLAKLN